MSKKIQLPNIHPGEILEEEFLKPLGITQYRLAKDLRVPQTRIAAIVKRRRAITPDTAMRLSRYFNTTAHFWLNLQVEYDLEALKREKGIEIERIQPADALGEFASG